MEEIRINKYLAQAGICSRREADALIEAKKVTVNGVIAQNGMKVSDQDKIIVNGKAVNGRDEKVYLAFYKPKGIVCTASAAEENNLKDYIDYPVRVTYCGRLDKDSEGLLLLSNDGDLMQKLMKGANGHEREYLVRVEKPLSDDFIAALERGVYLQDLNVTTRPCKVRKISDVTFSIVLKQGLNRQIRRMCRVYDYHVRFLKRVRIENIQLGDLEEGGYRELTASEINELKNRIIKNNSKK